MKKSEVPPNWTELVQKSSEHVTDENYNLAKTWLFSDADIGDIAMQNTKYSQTLAGNTGTSVQSNLQTPAGNTSTSVQTNALSSEYHEVDFSRSNDALGISCKDSIPCPYSDSVSENIPFQHDLRAPPLINLETSGLRKSPRIAALNNNNDAPAIAAYTTSTLPISSRQITIPRPRLSFFLVFNLVGSLWTFATTVLTWLPELFHLWLAYQLNMTN